MAFSFESLKVYRDSLSWIQETHRCFHELDRHCPRSVKDQFYWVARGSVFECVAIVQVMARMGLLRDAIVTECYEQLSELSKMLTPLIRSVDALKDKISDSQSTSAIA